MRPCLCKFCDTRIIMTSKRRCSALTKNSICIYTGIYHDAFLSGVVSGCTHPSTSVQTRRPDTGVLGVPLPMTTASSAWVIKFYSTANTRQLTPISLNSALLCYNVPKSINSCNRAILITTGSPMFQNWPCWIKWKVFLYVPCVHGNN